MQHISLLSIKDPVFSAEAKMSIKKAETLFQAYRSKYQSLRSAIISQIANQNPDQPKASGAKSEDQIKDQSAGSALLSVTHSFIPFCYSIMSSISLLSFKAMFPPRLEANAATIAVATPPMTHISFKRFLAFSESLSATALATSCICSKI